MVAGRESGRIQPAMDSFVVIALLIRQVLAAPGTGEVASLVRNAGELLRADQPAKALVLLQRARSLDSTQVELDRLTGQCLSRLGRWVPPDAGSDWTASDDRFGRAIRENPDSMFQVAGKLADAENLSGAMRIVWNLSRSHASKTSYIKAFGDLRARQETKVSFHRDLARKAQGRGEVSEAVDQWRLAYSARPEDPVLRDMLEKAERTREATLQWYTGDLRRSLDARDEASAMEILRKARIVLPDVGFFQVAFDSLDALRRSALAAKLRRIDSLVDQGSDQSAMDAMEALVESDPQESALAVAQSALQARIHKRRQRQKLDELSRSCDLAIQNGDLGKAEAVLADLKAAGAESPSIERIRARVDSLRETDRTSGAFNEALASARQALKAGDFAAGRSSLNKALTLKPDNPLAKGLLGSIANEKTAPPAAQKTVVAVPKSDLPSTSEQDAKKAKELLLTGVAAYRSGEYDKAIEDWKQVLVLDPGCVQAQKYLANVGLKQTRLK